MELLNTSIKITEKNGIFHIIEPLKNIHLTTDSLGVFLIKSLLSNLDAGTIFLAAKDKFKADDYTISNYIQEFKRQGLLLPSDQTPYYHTDYIHSYVSIPDGYSFHPNFLYWVISWDCNLRCKMCPLWSTNTALHTAREMKEKTLSLNESKKVIANLAKSKLSVIHITGGEPLLYPHLIEVVKEIKRHGIKVSVFSNGTLINKEFAQDLIKTGIDKIGISLDGTEKIHDLIRGKGNFLRAKNGLASLLSAREKNGTKCGIYIMNTITKYNYDSLAELLKFGSEIGADGMFVAHPSFSAPSSPKLQKQILSRCFLSTLEGPSWHTGRSKICDEVKEIPIEAINSELEELNRLSRIYNMEFSSNLSMTKEELNNYYTVNDAKIIERCLWPWQGGFMDPTGKIYPCIKIAVGDLKKDDFNELWNSDIYRRFRRLIKTRKTLPCCERCCQLIHEQAKIDAQLVEDIIGKKDSVDYSRKEVVKR